MAKTAVTGPCATCGRDVLLCWDDDDQCTAPLPTQETWFDAVYHAADMADRQKVELLYQTCQDYWRQLEELRRLRQ